MLLPSLCLALSFHAHALETPGADLWTGLLLGEIDTNNDSSVDSGEMDGGLAQAFSALDGDSSGSVSLEEVDSVKEEIAGTLGDTGAAVAVTLIKKLLKIEATKPLEAEAFKERGRSLFADLDADKSALVTEEELSALPAAVIKLLR
jgi:Ca2+-binding EF-hand superfamily protein